MGRDIHANLLRTVKVRITDASGSGKAPARAALAGMHEVFRRSYPVGRVDVALAACDVAAAILKAAPWCTCVFSWRLGLQLCEQGLLPITGYDVFKKWTLRALDDRGGLGWGVFWEPTVLDVTAAAKRLGCSPQYVRRLAREKRIDARRSPTGSWICDAASLNKYRSRRNGAHY